MRCDVAPIPSGVVIMCSRGRRRAVGCATPGCQGRGDFLCDFPLAGKKKGGTCNRPMCARCRHVIGPDVDYCAPHAKQTSLETAAPETFK